ncbi:MAG TPA: elongation factor G [Longimicrobiales bacterium]|nr:elongation factor G [Longimicrobiales bacterium]
MAAAKEYTSDRIRNVAVLGHGGSGKTTLIDALCFATGTSRRHGSVRDGTALTMYTDEETEHGISIQTAVAFADWNGVKVNLLDTPGYLDFTGDAVAATRVADGAVIVVGATTGVEVGTEKVWEYCEARSIPRLFFISQMDREHANFEKVLDELKRHMTPNAFAAELPIGEGEDFRGIVNLFTGQAHIYRKGTETGEYTAEPIPAGLEERANQLRTELFEAIAATDDALLERYLEGGEITTAEALAACRDAMLHGQLFPVFCGAPEKTWGVRALLEALVEIVPNPAQAHHEFTHHVGRDDEMELLGTDEGPFAALIFKTMAEPHVGELSYFRIFSGTVANGQDVYNATRSAAEKLAHLSVPIGRDRIEVERLHAGDIGVVAKLKNSHTNDTLSAEDDAVELDPIRFPEPDIALAVRAASRSDEDKIGGALNRLHEEDPTFVFGYDPEIRQTIIRGLGELHLDVQMERLKRKYHVEVVTEEPRIPYRETIRKPAEAQGKHKKQTGGHGQFGDAHVRLRPRERGAGYEFTNAITGGVVPGKFIPSVDKGVQEAARRGIIAGYPVVDFEAELFFGSYHSVDSSDMAFQIAGSLAFQKAAASADPVLLEPIVEVEVITPEAYMGDVMGDLNHRRGRILGMEQEGAKTRIKALVPQAELYKYATMLRSLTQGRAVHTRRFYGYEEAPQHVTGKIVEEAKREKEVEVHA